MFHFFHRRNRVIRLLERIMASLQEITASLSEARAEVAELNDKFVKVGGETAATLEKVTALETRIDELEAVIAAGGQSTPELDAVVAALRADLAAAKAQAQATDDLTPDAP